MISRSTAGLLLDFSARIKDPSRAEEQLEGAVALHNMLSQHSVAYLADEVGMGKTYVALGVMALFRHFQPNFRTLVIAPRENIQLKWMKEHSNFIRHNVRYPDLHVKGLDGRAARPLVRCDNLIGLLREAVYDPNRDFFARLTSFSLPISGDADASAASARKYRDQLRAEVPWLPAEAFDLRNKQDFKDNAARAICCALPEFDLLIVDEGHNLKHGFRVDSAARNRVLALAFGHPDGGRTNRRMFPQYGPRARRVLFLSATPIEESYRQLWNQLDVFALGEHFADLKQDDLDNDTKKKVASQFLVRRVARIRTSDAVLTKNQYRREWRGGGVQRWDEGLQEPGDRQRLAVALVQKKVSELLGSDQFNMSFQIGMLASFESFLETAKVKKSEEELGTFDGSEQADDGVERDGIDVDSVNRIARDYRRCFKKELPHPKMDALVDSLGDVWKSGRKALIFTRRIGSVRELKRKLDESYDRWLLGHLRAHLPAAAVSKLDELIETYEKRRASTHSSLDDITSGDLHVERESDCGGTDTFFAWFFRGDGPPGVISGANIQRRFTQSGTVYSTFFEMNHVADLLGCRPGEVVERLCLALRRSRAEVSGELALRGAKYMGESAKPARGERFEAAQAAAVEWLSETDGAHREMAGIVWRERFEGAKRMRSRRRAAVEVAEWLELPTFFTELREHPSLRACIWPEPGVDDPALRFRERELRASMLAAAARLGHAFIDLYVLTIKRLGGMDARSADTADGDDTGSARHGIEDYIQMLEEQRKVETSDAGYRWAAFHELEAISLHFDLIMDVNDPEAHTRRLNESAREFGTWMGRQKPAGGTASQVNRTLIRQFRMPGYPFVLVSTDLLQEGEDLHTFCSEVYHYGISWMPSSMEQRVGRLDRVRSLTARRLAGLSGPVAEGTKLQVYYPYLADTVEILQVQRVLGRMNTFLKLMHENLGAPPTGGSRLDVRSEALRHVGIPPQIDSPLESAFPIRPVLLDGPLAEMRTREDEADKAVDRFACLRDMLIQNRGISIQWEPVDPGRRWMLLGTALIDSRRQPFSLQLQSLASRLLVHCMSPVGQIDEESLGSELVDVIANQPARVCVLPGRVDASFNCTVEDDVLLGDPAHDAARVAWLIANVTRQADALESTCLPGQDATMGEVERDLAAEEQDEQ